MSPYDVDSHSVTPKLHTSERESNRKKNMHSGAYHLMGHLPAASAYAECTHMQPFYCHYKDQPVLAGTQGKNRWTLLEQSFTAHGLSNKHTTCFVNDRVLPCFVFPKPWLTLTHLKITMSCLMLKIKPRGLTHLHKLVKCDQLFYRYAYELGM